MGNTKLSHSYNLRSTFMLLFLMLIMLTSIITIFSTIDYAGIYNLQVVQLVQQRNMNADTDWLNRTAANIMLERVNSKLNVDYALRFLGVPPDDIKAKRRQYRIIKNNSYYSMQNLDSCSIVGNAGVLLGSDCGDVIDAADFVIRMNLAPFNGNYVNDVGAKVDLVTINNEQSRLLSECTTEQYAHITYEKLPLRCQIYFNRFKLINESVLWYHKKTRVKHIMRALVFLKKYHGLSIRLAYSPSTALYVSRVLFNIRYPSTGVMVYATAVQFCSRITLFGFYPFNVDPTNRTLLNHYYDRSVKDFTKEAHKIPTEFRGLMKLQETGAVRIINDCAGRWDHRIMRKSIKRG